MKLKNVKAMSSKKPMGVDRANPLKLTAALSEPPLLLDL
jgi:hypothetical protein